MEPPLPSSAPPSSPRVFVPISHRDSPVPTYTVLQLVGLCDPASQSHNLTQALVASAPSPVAGTGNARSSALCAPKFDSRDPSSAATMESFKSGAADSPRPYTGNFAAEGTLADNEIPEDSSTGNPSPQGSSTGNSEPKAFCLDNPSPKGSCIDSSSCTSQSKGFDKRAVSIKPSPMKKSGVAGPCVASSAMKKNSKGLGPSTLTVSHTERETIIHTHCSNFREVVHQLTGASSNDNDLLPVTLPSRFPANRGIGEDVHEAVEKCEYAGRVPDLGLRKPMPAKLFERRRSSKTLERISTSCRDLPPLVPSPVTPLASDFERICLPVTPQASPVGAAMMPMPEHGIVQTQFNSNLQRTANVQLYSNHNQSAMYMYANSNQLQTSIGNTYSPSSEPRAAQVNLVASHHETSVEDLAIAEKGFFLHPQRPRSSEPALLPLFPESPRG